MSKKILHTSLAYVAVLTGAGLASGQEILQYFTAYGKSGLWTALFVLLLHTFIGAIILELGSYYFADEHSDVLDEIASKKFTKVFDILLILTGFIIGFVMLSGAGSNLNQQFGLAPWIGSLICALLVIFVGMMDFEKVTRIIGAFTPIIVALILIASIYTIVKFDGSFDQLDPIARTIPKNFGNPWLSVVNYFSLCMMVGLSTAFAIGGNHVLSEEAKVSGLLGGFITGTVTSLLAVVLFMRVDILKDSDLPTQVLIEEINPILGLIMSLVIFGMIFNTAIGLYYSLAKRFSKSNPAKYKMYLIGFVTVGFFLSFLGFKKLISITYPIIGYAGIVLILFLIYAYIRDFKKIKKESKRRFKILDLLEKKYDDDQHYSKKDASKVKSMINDSNLDNKVLKEEMETMAEENQSDDDDEENTEE